MLGKKAKSRLLILASLLILLSILVFIVLRSLEENVVYFLSPTDIYNKSNITFDKKIRDGGLVKVNSIRKNEKSVKVAFSIITKHTLFCRIHCKNTYDSQ